MARRIDLVRGGGRGIGLPAPRVELETPRLLRDLAVVPRVVGPHARLGFAWAVLSVVAVLLGPVALALVLAPAAAAAGDQAAASWRSRSRRPARPVAAAGAGLLVLAAAAGPLAIGVTAALLVGLLGLSTLAGRDDHHADRSLTAVIALAVGLAGAAPVLLRHQGLVAVFVLLAFVHVYDTSAYVVGTGASSVWEGRVAGIASIGAVTLAVAAVLVPPFRGSSPWVLGALAAMLAPLGPCAGSALLGDRRVRAPALRRLDSLLVLGPLWALAAALLLG